MVCFEVTRNGQRLATASGPEKGVLSFHMNRVIGSQRSPADSQEFDLWASDWGKGPNEIAHWCSGPLALGDEFIVRVVDMETADAPTQLESSPPDTSDVIEKKRRDLAELEGLVRLLRRSLGVETSDGP